MTNWLTQLLEYSPYLSVFIMGLLGGVHCLGMCGGIVSALSLGQSRPGQRISLQARLPVLLGYNLGRISSYVIAGALAGGLGALTLSTADAQQTQTILQNMQLISAAFMIALGLYLANIWRGIAYLEHAGKMIWKHIEPAGRHLLPVNNAAKAVPFGLIWGWLPCGLVYTFLIMSLSSGSAGKGALLMLCFGLGTLPNLLLMGTVAGHLLQWARKPSVRLGAGLTVTGLGLWMFYQAINS
ncbi:MAG: sulfite exporter TauE/SafE family protein [Thiolinea sp.]